MNIKEIIYLDNTLVNSLLSQLNKGIVTKLIEGNEETETSNSTVTTSSSNTINAGVNIGFSTSGSNTQTEFNSEAAVLSENNKKLIESALNDYSLDLLIKNLEDNNLLKDEKKEGTFIIEEGKLEIFNFEQTSQSSDLMPIEEFLDGYYEYRKLREILKKSRKSNNINKVKKLETEIKETGWHNIHLIHTFSEYAKKILPNTSAIKINNNFALCPHENFKMNINQLLFSSHIKRKIKVLAIISTKIENTPLEHLGKHPESNIIFQKATDTYISIIMDSLKILNITDYIVRPIAIYFEN